jgi:tRNA pseudouridine13 synthase
MADPDWQAMNNDEIEVLQACRHSRKLKTGTLKGNSFTLRLHELQGDLSVLNEQLETIKSAGVPNYFGEQRFGNQAENLGAAQAFLFERKKVNRNQKSILLSAARSLLFNAVLNARVRAGSWLFPLVGDVLQKDGRRGSFVMEVADDDISQRLAAGEIHITGPLWGRGRNNILGEAAALERMALEPFVDWCDALERKGLELDRRAMRANVSELNWSIEGKTLELHFSLVAGSYATSVLRECVNWCDA